VSIFIVLYMHGGVLQDMELQETYERAAELKELNEEEEYTDVHIFEVTGDVEQVIWR
jgi:hypothetical protein